MDGVEVWLMFFLYFSRFIMLDNDCILSVTIQFYAMCENSIKLLQ